MKLNCGNCGSSNVKKTNVKGREFDWRHIKRIKLLIDVNLQVCSDCSNIIYYYEDFKKLDDALVETLYLGKSAAIKALCEMEPENDILPKDCSEYFEEIDLDAENKK